MSKITEWNPGEKMSKEFAVDFIKYIKLFCRRLYYQPTIKPFNSDIDFKAVTQTLDGLRDLIDEEITEQQVSDTNSNPAL